MRPPPAPGLCYAGAPPYRYAGDHSTADATGDGVDGAWFAVRARGEGEGSSTTTTPERYGY